MVHRVRFPVRSSSRSTFPRCDPISFGDALGLSCRGGAERIDVRLSDGRVLPARLIAQDAASDIAILGVDMALPAIPIAPKPTLTQPVCAIGNAYGLGLSVTCGVVSALNVSNAGFNPVEDFIQTDAASNPGVSGGALVDNEGRLVGMMSAIFASGADTNIGINFAVSAELLTRVVNALMIDGAARYPSPGWRLVTPGREQLAALAAPIVLDLEDDGPAATAGLAVGDVVLRIADRAIKTPRDAIAALAVIPQDQTSVEVMLQRDGVERTATLNFGDAPVAQDDAAPADAEVLGDCPHPEAVCRVRQAVFPVSSFDPVASATRIGPNLLVTNRHVVANRPDAIVHTPSGPRGATVIASAYLGDLALLEVEGLPEDGFIPAFGREPALEVANDNDEDFYAVGADVARQQVRVFDPGGLIATPAPDADLGRIHVFARMQPGVSGGALVDSEGDLVGIAVGGGDRRFEAIPIAQVETLLALRDDGQADAVTRRLGQAISECAAGMDGIQPRAADTAVLDTIAETCAATQNYGQLLEAGRILAQAGDFDAAIALHGAAVEQVPNSINARISLLVSLQLAGRFDEMTGHARWLMEMAPDDPQALRFAIQSGVWGGAPELAEQGYQALLAADPRQAEAARRFIDNAPPAPPRR
jgi:S1-C subfamily serine protease